MSGGLCALVAGIPVVMALLSCPTETGTVVQGYVEGDFLRIGPEVAGRIQSVSVSPGDDVARGQLLFALDPAMLQAARDQMAAELTRAEAVAADLATGSRPEELEVLRARRDAAAAALTLSEAELTRQQVLLTKGNTPKSTVEAARAARDRDRASLAETDAALAVGGLGGRAGARQAAAAAVGAARAALDEADLKLARARVPAPESGRITDHFHEPGEWVAAGAPVLELLPPANIKVRFFVPEALLSMLRLGAPVTITCDGCPVTPAQVSFIASQAEYTPPVIYSREIRAKLVFAAEALPDDPTSAGLHPGQPVDVRLDPQ